MTRKDIGFFPYAWTPKVLPLVYNDALSYLENVYALIHWCNELAQSIIENYNSLSKMIAQAEQNANNYTDLQLISFREDFSDLSKELNAEIEKLISDTELTIKLLELKINKQQEDFENKINQQFYEMKMDNAQAISELKKEFAQYQQEINVAFNKLNGELVQLRIDFNKYRVQVDAYIDTKCEELKGWVESHTAITNGNNIFVWNPVKSNTDTLKNTLEDLYITWNYGAITAQEYSDMGLTAQEYADKMITAYQYAYEARFTFFENIYFVGLYKKLEETIEYVNAKISILDDSLKMVNPLTGKRDYISKVVNMLAEYHLNTLTAKEYQDKGWTANEYASLDWTAEYYAFSSAGGAYGNVIGGNLVVISFEDSTKTIVDLIKDNIEAIPRARPIVLSVIGSDGIGSGIGLYAGSVAEFNISTDINTMRIVYKAGNWTTNIF